MGTPLLQFTKKGIYCDAAGVYLDPWKPVDKALITHGHADHSRWGHKKYITHHDNIPIISHRLGDINVSGIAHGESLLINNVKFSFHPAGHIPGSCQIRVEHKDEIWVFTGDYKTEDDGISTPYEAVKCDTFITECTFGLPAFKWQPQSQVMHDVNTWCAQNHADGKTSILFAYSLGKAQRLIKHLDTASASGWMTLRGARRRRAMDKGFVLSDHCDWDGLLESIDATGCENVITTHGYQEIFAQFAQLIRTIDGTNKTNLKVTALSDYFKTAPDDDKLWTIAILSHRRPKRPVNTTLMREWATDISGIPMWLFEESYHIVGDLATSVFVLIKS